MEQGSATASCPNPFQDHMELGETCTSWSPGTRYVV